MGAWVPIFIGLLVLYVPTFYDLARSHWVQDDHAHGPIVLGVVLWLIWDRRRSLATPTSDASPVAGLTSLVFGSLAYILGRSQGIPIFEVGALVPLLAGILLAMRGWSGVREYWFALLYVVYLLPLPGFVVDAATLPLTQAVSVVAANIIHSAGYPIAQDGVVLFVGRYQLLVADACSGLNSMFSLSSVGLLYLYLMRRKSRIHNIAMVVSLIPVAFCANIARVVALILVTYYFGESAGQGMVHDFSGMLMFVVALTIIVLIDAILLLVTTRRSATKL